MAAGTKTRSELTPWAFAIIAVPLILLAVEIVRGSLAEMNMVRNQTLRATLQESRGQAQGRATGLAVLLEAEEAADRPWSENRNQPWLTRYWSNIDLVGEHELYAAVVDDSGNIVMHTDVSKLGQRLDRGWYERRVPEAGPDVVWTSESPLGGNRPTYDVALPLSVGEQSLGEYHEGIDARWMESKIAAEQHRVRGRWLWVLALVGAVDAAAIGALMFLARRQRGLWRKLKSECRERAREIAQIGAGLAHEVRNPLHALRINLHTLKRSFGKRAPLPEEQVLITIDESNAAINRLDELMRDLLQFSDPTVGEAEEVDLAHEVRAALNLLIENLRHQEIEVHASLTDEATPIVIDPVRLRQSLHNLLTFAQHRAGKKGTIKVTVTKLEGCVQIDIEDSGPVLPEHQRAHLFEPFQAPAETGSGLGLALVHTHVEEAGGRAAFGCNGHPRGCQIWLPLATSAHKGGTP